MHRSRLRDGWATIGCEEAVAVPLRDASPRLRSRSSRLAVPGALDIVLSRPPADTSAKGDTAAGVLAAVAVGVLLSRWLTPAEDTIDSLGILYAAVWPVADAVGLLLVWRSRRVVRFDAVDAAIVLTCFGPVLAGLFTLFRDANLRLAVNGTSEWASTACAVLLLRRCGARAVLRPLSALIVGLAVLAVVQRVYWQPQTAAAYERFAELATLADESRLSAAEADELSQLVTELGDEAERALEDRRRREGLRQRVVFSTEPIGFFALANTFATGLLIGACLFATHLADPRSTHRDGRRSRWRLAVFFGLVAVALLLTKSRTAFVAGGLCVGLLAGLRFRRTSVDAAERTRTKSTLAVVLGFAVVVVGGLLAVATLDLQVVTEAPKSLRYRLEYWVASGRLLMARPLLGSGLGQFRPHYLQHKLPGASEEVADPHNWVIEALATGGLATGVVTVAGIVSLLIVSGRTVWSAPSAGHTSKAAARPLDAGAVLVATLVAFVLGESAARLAVVLIPALATIAILPECSAATWRRAAALAGLAVAVHLLGAGGFGMAAIVQTWLTLLAVAVPLAESNASHERASDARGRVFPPLALLVATVVLAVAALFASVRPTHARIVAIADAKAAEANGRLGARVVDVALAADPLSPQAWVEVGLSPARLPRQRLAAAEEAVARDPLQPRLHLFLAGQRLANDVGGVDAATGEAVRLYPNSALLHAERAELTSDPAPRRESAARALRLDDALREAGHLDKTFAEPRRRQLEAWSERS